MAYQAAMQEESLRRGPWLKEEDKRLITFVTLLGDRRWDYIAKQSGLRRSGKSCRLRWLNYLRPNIKRGHISAEEEQMILQLHELWGNKWSRIAQKLPGRTDNEIKNYWRSHLRKKAEVLQEQEIFQYGRTNAKQDFLIQKVDTNVQKYDAEDRSVKDISGTTDTSVDNNLVLSNSEITSSPYETRLSDWISELSNDQSEIKHHEDCNSMESCFCYPTWKSEEDTDTWDCSGSLWDMD